MFAMVALTFSTLIRLFRARYTSIVDGTVKASYFKLYLGDPEPEASTKLSRHLINQFEAPVLFYVCCLAAMATQVTHWGLIVLAWIYVALRVIHTIVHTGKNRLKPRAWSYFASWGAMLMMWLILAVRVAAPG